ncbi:hypothetical protein EMIT0180MI3_11469 [Priestia megaterium]
MSIMATSAFLRFNPEICWYAYNFISVLSVKFIDYSWFCTVCDTTREKNDIKN